MLPLSITHLEDRRLLCAQISIVPLDAIKPEGNSDYTAFTFSIIRSGDRYGAVNLDYSVEGSRPWQADAADFGGEFPSGEIHFAPGETLKTLTVNVRGDLAVEPDEWFRVCIRPEGEGTVARVEIARPVAWGLIKNDDLPGDLRIAKSDGLTSAVPGTTITYQILVSNDGPGNVLGATLNDTFPEGLINVTYVSEVTRGRASGNSSSLAGDATQIHDTLDMEAGSEILYTVTATILPNATGALQNTATIEAPYGFLDPNLCNNAATDVTQLCPQGDLSVTKGDEVSVVVPGQRVTYTIVVANSGPSDARGIVFRDVFATDLVDVWYSSAVLQGVVTGNTSDGSGLARRIDDELSLSAGAVVVYTVSGTVAADIAVPLQNVAAVTAPQGFADLDAANNVAEDTDRLAPRLSIREELAVRWEGNSGTTFFTFVVVRTGDTSEAVSVRFWASGGGSAPADAADFGGVFPSGVVTLEPGATEQTVAIGVAGDVQFEPDEQFVVTLFGASSNAVLGASEARGLIRDDDLAAAIIGNAGGEEDSSQGEEDAARMAALAASAGAGAAEGKGEESSPVIAESSAGEAESSMRAAATAADEEEEKRSRLGEIRLFFVIVGVSGEESAKQYELPASVLEGDRLVELFKKFPNGHYRVYLQQDRSIRRLYDLHIYGHQLVTPEVPPGELGLPQGGGVEDVAPSAAPGDGAALQRSWPERVDRALEAGCGALSRAARRAMDLKIATPSDAAS